MLLDAVLDDDDDPDPPSSFLSAASLAFTWPSFGGSYTSTGPASGFLAVELPKKASRRCWDVADVAVAVAAADDKGCSLVTTAPTAATATRRVGNSLIVDKRCNAKGSLFQMATRGSARGFDFGSVLFFSRKNKKKRKKRKKL